MALENPFVNDPVKGDVWEQGFLAGFAEPEVDHLRPFSQELLEIYGAGEQVGRDERRRLPPNSGGEPEDGGDESQLLSFLIKLAEEAGVHTMGHFVLHGVFKNVGGLLTLMPMVIGIPGDVQLGPIDPDFTGPVDQPEEHFIALCPRDDHPIIMTGVVEGYWAGLGRDFYSEALTDMKAHGHPEAVVARCAFAEGTCGAIWPGRGL